MPLLFRRPQVGPPPRGNYEEPCAMLRYSVPIRVEHARRWLESLLPESVHHAEENRAVVPPCHVGNVLQQDDPRLQPVDDLDEAMPQLSSVVARPSLYLRDEVADLRASGTRERLTRRTACNEVNRFDASHRQIVEKLL